MRCAECGESVGSDGYTVPKQIAWNQYSGDYETGGYKLHRKCYSLYTLTKTLKKAGEVK